MYFYDLEIIEIIVSLDFRQREIQLINQFDVVEIISTNNKVVNENNFENRI